MKESMIDIELLRCTVLLKLSEVQRLLRLDKELYKESLRYGKYIERSRTQQERKHRKFEQVNYHEIDFPL